MCSCWLRGGRQGLETVQAARDSNGQQATSALLISERVRRLVLFPSGTAVTGRHPSGPVGNHGSSDHLAEPVVFTPLTDATRWTRAPMPHPRLHAEAGATGGSGNGSAVIVTGERVSKTVNARRTVMRLADVGDFRRFLAGSASGIRHCGTGRGAGGV